MWKFKHENINITVVYKPVVKPPEVLIKHD